jgi:hypothetical protein
LTGRHGGNAFDCHARYCAVKGGSCEELEAPSSYIKNE